MSETLERLREAETAEAQLNRLHDLAAQAPRLREQVEHERQQAVQHQRLEATKAEAAQMVETVKPEIEALRAEIQQWAADGWDMIERLNVLERPLTDTLARLAGIAASEARSKLPASDTEALILHDFDADVAQALEQVGALADDLEALPPDGNQFAQELKALFAKYAPRYVPSLRGRQFRRGSPI